MNVPLNTLDYNNINAKDLRLHLQNIIDNSKESDGTVVTAEQSSKAKEMLELLGSPIYTTFLDNYDAKGMTLPTHLYNLASVLDYLYMTGGILTVYSGSGSNANDRKTIRCDREHFYITEFQTDSLVPIKESKVQEVTMEDIIDKRLKYGRLLKDVEGIDLLESISDTKGYFITKLNMLKQFGSSESAQHILSFEGNSQVEEKIFDTWINDIENM